MKNLTELICIIDRSGSMQSIRDDAIGGFNAFLNEQKKVPGNACLSLVLFDHEYTPVYSNTPLSDVPELTPKSYVPRGTTALYDAVGRTLNETGARLASLIEEERPDKVMVIILTDGLENSSKEFTHKQIAEMIEHQRTKYSWEFIFLAANQDAMLAAKNMNISTGNALNFAASGDGIKAAYKRMSLATAFYRTSSPDAGSNNLFSEDKDA